MKSSATPHSTVPSFVGVFLVVLTAFVAAEALFAVGTLSWVRAVSNSGYLQYLVGMGTAVIGITVALIFRERLFRYLNKFSHWTQSFKPNNWLLMVVTIGVVIRIIWVFAYPAPPTSDAATYIVLSQRLVAGEPYQSAGYKAFWPPGYPFFLAPWVKVFGASILSILTINIILFIATLLSVMTLAQRFFGVATARLTSVILVVWPSYFTLAGLPTKELLLAFLLPLTLLIFSLDPKRKNFFSNYSIPFFAGSVLGFASLVQPSIQLFFIILVIFDIARRTPLLQIPARLILVLVGMIIIISPWSLRNYQAFGEHVLIATNGGSVLYRSNNPLATGGWTPHGVRDINKYDELTENHMGYKYATEWISKNPDKFLKLSAWKQILFLGDDSTGVYETLKRGLGIGGIWYLSAKGFSNLFWAFLWILVIIGLHRNRSAFFDNPMSVALAFSFFYFYGIHTIFESGGKYHIPVLGLFGILVAALLLYDTNSVTRERHQNSNRSL